MLPQVVQYNAPNSGDTIIINANTDVLIIEPSGAILTLTVTFPTGFNGKIFSMSSTQAITTVTLGGGVIVNAITTLAASGFAQYVYRLANTSWYRIG